MAAILNIDFARDQAAKLTRTIPANLKAPTDWVGKFEQFHRDMRRAALEPREDRQEAFYELEAQGDAIRDGIESLQNCEHDLGEILDASRGLLLLLSRLEGTIRNMGPEAGEALDKYVAAIREAS